MVNGNSKCVYNRLFIDQPYSSCPMLTCPCRRICKASVKQTAKKNNVLISAISPHDKETIKIN